MKNSAFAVLKQIGGTAADMTTAREDREATQAFLRQDAKDNPKEARIPKLLRSYHKRYRNNMAEYIRAIRRKSLTPAKTA